MYLDKYFIYRHIRKDKNEPFYIGLGTINKRFNSFGKQYQRAFAKNSRNTFWHNITNKTEWYSEIIFESADKNEILNKEKEFIKLYGRKDLNKGTLVNHTDGGEFNKGYKVSEKRKKELSDNWKGEKNPNFNKRGKDHPAYNKGGFKGNHTEEAKKKISKPGYFHPLCKLNKEQVEEIQKAWNNRNKKITKKDFCYPFEIKFNVKYRVIYNALKYKI